MCDFPRLSLGGLFILLSKLVFSNHLVVDLVLDLNGPMSFCGCLGGDGCIQRLDHTSRPPMLRIRPFLGLWLIYLKQILLD